MPEQGEPEPRSESLPGWGGAARGAPPRPVQNLPHTCPTACAGAGLGWMCWWPGQRRGPKTPSPSACHHPPRGLRRDRAAGGSIWERCSDRLGGLSGRKGATGRVCGWRGRGHRLLWLCSRGIRLEGCLRVTPQEQLSRDTRSVHRHQQKLASKKQALRSLRLGVGSHVARGPGVGRPGGCGVPPRHREGVGHH